MFCKKCGTEVGDTSKFCAGCGDQVVPTKKILPASILRRFSNYVVDRIVISIISVIILSIGAAIDSSFVTFVGFVVLFGGYYVFCEALFQRTVGKCITKTKVVTMSGAKPKFWTIVGRTLCRFIPFEPLSYLFGGFPVGWHDSITKTLVVPSHLTPEEVQSMDMAVVKKEKSNNVAAVIVVIVVCGLMLMAVIGIIASVVLASLNTARAKGQDAQTKAVLMNMYAQSEMYSQTTNGSYLGFCNDQQTSMVANSFPEKVSATCNDADNGYAISAELRSGNYYCADSTGARKEVSRGIVLQEISCPQD